MICSHCGMRCACERAIWTPAERVIETFAEIANVTVEKLVGRQRDSRMCDLRHVCVYLTRRFTHMSWMALAAVWDRDHATLIHSTKKAEYIMAHFPYFARLAEAVSKELADKVAA